MVETLSIKVPILLSKEGSREIEISFLGCGILALFRDSLGNLVSNVLPDK